MAPDASRSGAWFDVVDVTYHARMEAALFSLTVLPVLLAIGLFILYWVIRLAVRHGIRDADHQRWKRRSGGSSW
jgi:hypothetical protein